MQKREKGERFLPPDLSDWKYLEYLDINYFNIFHREDRLKKKDNGRQDILYMEK